MRLPRGRRQVGSFFRWRALGCLVRGDSSLFKHGTKVDIVETAHSSGTGNDSASGESEATGRSGVGTSRWRNWSLVAIVVVTAALYGRTVGFDLLLWDDVILIARNPHVVQVSLSSLVHNWTQPFFEIYMPATYTLWMVESIPAYYVPKRLGLDSDVIAPVVYHATSVALFVILSCQVYRLLSRFVRDEAACLLGALFFAVHPVQVESVAWASENKGLLAGIFGVSAILGYVDWVRGGATSRRAYVSATIAFVLALLSKPSAVTVPLIAVIVDCGLLRRPLARAASGTWIWFLFSAGMVGVTSLVQTTAGEVHVPWKDRPIIAMDALVFYGQKLVWPTVLLPNYGRTPESVLGNPSQARMVAAVASVIVGVVLALLAWRRQRVALAIVFWIAATLVTNLGFAPFAYQLISTVADRYLSPALVPISLGIALLLEWLRRPFFQVLFAALLAGLCWLTVAQVGHWRGDSALADHAIAGNSRSYVFWDQRLTARLLKGDADAAISAGTTAFGLRPDRPVTRFNLARAYLRKGEIEKAKGLIGERLKSHPDDESFLDAAMAIAHEEGRYDQAVEYAERLLKLTGNSPSRQVQYAHQLILAGREAEGLKVAAAAGASGSKQDSMSLLEQETFLAKVHEDAGNYGEAIRRFRAIMSRFGLRGVFAQLRLAWVLATAQDDSVRDPVEALAVIQKLGQELATRGEDKSAYYLDVLAAVMASNGDFDGAVVAAERARKAAQVDGQSAFAKEITSRLKLYRDRKPFIVPPRLWLGTSLGK